MPIVSPPVEADLTGLVERTDNQSDTDREELDFSQGDLDVPAYEQAFVEHTVEDFDQSSRLWTREI